MSDQAWSDLVGDESSIDSASEEHRFPPLSDSYYANQNNFLAEHEDDGKFAPQHRRSRSLNSHGTGSLPRLNFALLDQPPNCCLPAHLSSMVGEPPDPSLDGYKSLLSFGDTAGASALLNKLTSSKRDKKEECQLLRSAAEVCKQTGYIPDACAIYERAEKIDPEIPQVYLDHAKMLDELGRWSDAERVLLNGAVATRGSDSLLSKMVKQYERRQHFRQVREALGLLVQKCQLRLPSLLEGLLFECRHGPVPRIIQLLELNNSITSQDKPDHYNPTIDRPSGIGRSRDPFRVPLRDRSSLNSIPTNTGSNQNPNQNAAGGEFSKSGFDVEAAEAFRRRGYPEAALSCARHGASRFPTMPNCWIALMNQQRSPKAIQSVLSEARSSLTGGSLSKLQQAAAQRLGALGSLRAARSLMSEAVASAVGDQRWRLLHNAALLELFCGDRSITGLLIDYATHQVGRKYAGILYLLLAKLSESAGDLKNANHIYRNLRQDQAADWRVYLEAALFELRRSNNSAALKIAKEGLQLHPGTGRLWALVAQLETGAAQVAALTDAVFNAPKSGEVWAEVARFVLNPLSCYFSLKTARFALETAYMFTPQYVDVFVELVRLRLLEEGLNASVDDIGDLFVAGDGSYGNVVFMFRRPGEEFTGEEWERLVGGVREDLRRHSRVYQRAIARSSFVCGSIRGEEEKLRKEQAEYEGREFAFGLSSFLKASSDSTSRISVIFGSSGVFA